MWTLFDFNFFLVKILKLMEIINCEGYYINHQLIVGDLFDFTVNGGLNLTP